MKPTYCFLLILMFLFSCESENFEDLAIENENSEESDQEGEETEEPINSPSTTTLRTYIFGHSLLVHDPPLIPTPSNETTVPHWMADLAASANYDFAVSGQYGFLTSHRNLPPISQWGFDLAQSAWESDSESFADADFNSILLTAANFIQYQPASENYWNENYSPIEATIEIFDWTINQEPEINLYIYENWPDMAGFIDGEGFPPSATEFDDYNEFTQNEFHDWWMAYHDAVVAQRPNWNVKMIPVGPIISGLLTETPLNAIQITELYEDNAPHGRPTIYFLASLVTYMGMYGTQASIAYDVPDTIDPLVAQNYEGIINYIWEALEEFNFEDGSSRVFQ